MSADCVSRGRPVGCAAVEQRQAPAACGLAIDVPEMKPHLTSSSMPPAARMSTPGAESDGLIIETARLGPRLENAAMMSATSSPMWR